MKRTTPFEKSEPHQVSEGARPAETYPTDDDCVDCGKVHTPGPCVKCENCDRDYYLKDLSIRSDSTYICASCDLIQQGLTPAAPAEAQLEFPWGKLVNK